MARKTLILTVGLPRSGKSTWARQQAVPTVNPDSIRLALHGQRFEPLAEPFVWAIAKVMVRSLFGAGHPSVVLDATNTTRKRRAGWQDDAWGCVFAVIDTPAEVCIQRARAADDEGIIPIIDRMAAQYEPVESDEEGHIFGTFGQKE